MKITIPPPLKTPFRGPINHPALYLWDAWSYWEGNELHLYCLALSRTDGLGNTLAPVQRNSWPFHVRHFLSTDGANTWSDMGAFLQPSAEENTHDSKTIWSGSVALLPDGKKLVAYTGLYEGDATHNFQQNIALAVSNDGHKIDQRFAEPLSCPSRDWQMIVDTGYYLDKIENVGSDEGENGGPIMAWRDPFVFVDDKEKIHLFWAAKVSSHRSALAHALLEKTRSGYSIATLFPPVVMPDGDEFTQLELPKVLHDNLSNKFYLIIATCNRLYEGQTDAEVDKKVRLYSSSSMTGPWQPCGINGSVVLEEKSHMFGVTALRADYDNGELFCIAPYTDAAENGIALTLSRPFTIRLDPAKTS